MEQFKHLKKIFVNNMILFLSVFVFSILFFISVKKFLPNLTQPQRSFIQYSETKAKYKPIACGGVLFFFVFAVFYITQKGCDYMFITLAGFFVIGLLDDVGKVFKKSHISFFKGKWRFVIECIFALLFVFYFLNGKTTYILQIHNYTMHTPLWFAFPFLVFIIVGTANAVNLTDGQDTLAGKVILLHLLFLMALAFGNLPLIAALLAFLIFNAKPATIYMGDSSSLFFGSLIAIQFIQAKIEWLLPITGIVFVVEAASVILQVAYFKYTKGKRIFKMSPFHHHLELSGFSEEKISNFAFVITFITCICALLILQNAIT